jgi:hypothetical protein
MVLMLALFVSSVALTACNDEPETVGEHVDEAIDSAADAFSKLKD